MERLKRLVSSTLGRPADPARAVKPIPDIKSQRMLSKPALGDPVRPIFVIGAPRSGTSITNWALGQHPNIQPMPETVWIASFAVGVQSSYFIGSERGRFSHLSNVGLPADLFFRRMGEAVDRIVNDVFEERCTRMYGDWRNLGRVDNPAGQEASQMRLRRHVDDPKKRWVDATPLNSMYVAGLAMLFPEAVFIHNLRQPHEVVASLANFDAAGGLSLQIADGIRTWTDHVYACHMAQRALGPQRVYTARFDQLTSDPRSFFDGILKFAGEEWSEDCLAPMTNKINSSQVDDQREHVLAMIAGNPAYQRAKALYDDVISHPTSAEPDADALREIMTNFQRLAVQQRCV